MATGAIGKPKRQLSEAQRRYAEAARAAAERLNAERVGAAKAYIEDHYARNPSLREVAAHVGLSPFHFQRLFTKATGQTPKRAVDLPRIEEAKRMLLAGSGPAEVAAALGFAHQSHFTSRFKAYVGTPPARWVKRAARERGGAKAAAA